MKKYVLLTIFTCMCLGYLQAQSFKYGVKTGLNINNLAVSPEFDHPSPTSRLGFHIGGFVQFNLLNSLSIQPELTISTQGSEDENIDDWQRIKLSYLNLAAPFKYTLGNNLHFFIGPQLGFLTGGEFETEDKEDGEIETQSAKRLLSGTDVAIGLGIGYTSNAGIDFNLRYNHGLNDLNDDPAELGFYEPVQSIKSRIFQLSVGYIFNY